MNRFLIANLKMNGDKESLESLSQEYAENCTISNITTIICVPFVYLNLVNSKIQGSRVKLGAQDCSQYSQGAFTGDTSSKMLKDIGCKYVILGHSERRKYHHETEEIIVAKLTSALNVGLVPIICVGENLEERKTKKHLEVIKKQITHLNSNISQDIIIAYEPVWSIGTGMVPEVSEIEEVLDFIKGMAKFPLLYGGSVNGDNAASLAKIKGLDGFLVGGASLKFQEAFKIYQAL